MEVLYDLTAGLDHIIAGADYQGSLKNNTSQEYDDLVWSDARAKPTYADVVLATLEVMREYILTQIDLKTSMSIIGGFISSIDASVTILPTRVWQFNALNVYLNRNNTDFIVYPYDLCAGSTGPGCAQIYISLVDAAKVELLYSESYTHVRGWLDSGRALKDALAALTQQELLDYEDNR